MLFAYLVILPLVELVPDQQLLVHLVSLRSTCLEVVVWLRVQPLMTNTMRLMGYAFKTVRVISFLWATAAVCYVHQANIFILVLVIQIVLQDIMKMKR